MTPRTYAPQRNAPIVLAVLVACAPARPPAPAPVAPAEAVAAVPAAPPPQPAAPVEPPAAACGAGGPIDEDAAPTIDDNASDDGDEDEFARERRARTRLAVPRALAARLKAALPRHRPACDVALHGPCAVQGDLDGDGRRDDVVLVRSERGAGGLAILWGKGGVDLLGGGRRGQCWQTTELPNLDGAPIPAPSLAEIDADLGWLHAWALAPLERSSAGAVFLGHGRRYTATDAVGDGLHLDGGDAAALVHRRADGWTLLDLGF